MRRRQAREIALQFLYGFDLNPRELDPALADLWKSFKIRAEEREFAAELIRGTIAEKDRLDALIEKHAHNWKLGRIALIDRNILRLGLYELSCCDDIPPKVSINEAVDLAKKFSTDQSGSFVNGILDQAREELGRGEAKKPKVKDKSAEL
jgi:N utilization substance protein B